MVYLIGDITFTEPQS